VHEDVPDDAATALGEIDAATDEGDAPDDAARAEGDELREQVTHGQG
jgi:hypothetical protein